MSKERIRVVELFAGVGGFRVGFEKSSPIFDTVWANQWEPGQKGQWAYKCYVKNFGNPDKCSNEDIATVIEKAPEHDLLQPSDLLCTIGAVAVTCALRNQEPYLVVMVERPDAGPA